jgi:hypothetical protein
MTRAYDALPGRNRTVWIDDALWSILFEKAQKDGHHNISLTLRTCLYEHLKTNPQPAKRHIPARFHNTLRILELMAKTVGERKVSDFDLDYQDKLIGLFPYWYQARDAVTLLAFLLKRVSKVTVLIDEQIEMRRIPGGSKRDKKRVRVGFALAFEYPVNGKALLGYKESITRELQESDLMDMLVRTEFTKLIPKIDESKEVRKKIGVDDLNKMAETMKEGSDATVDEED